MSAGAVRPLPGTACPAGAGHRAAEAFQGRHNRLVSLSPHAPSPADLAVRLRDRRHHAPLPARPPGNQAKPAADITDWTALTPDDFFAALKTACRAGSVPAAAVPETERRLADRVLQARELHQVLLTTGQNDKWASVRQAALVALTERPDMAVTVVHLESQRLGSPAALGETADGASPPGPPSRSMGSP